MRIGARGSDLAQYQARWVKERLQQKGMESELVIIRTHGDKVQDRPLRELGVQGIFTRELEQALSDGQIDIAVHSYKDMATRQPEGLAIAAITEREDPADMLIINPEAYSEQGDFAPLKPGITVGTSAVRRQRQLLALRPDLEIKDLRGNVPTRLSKLAERQYGAIFAAAAGINRSGVDLGNFQTRRLDPLQFIPNPAQGALAVEMRRDDARFRIVRDVLHDENCAAATDLERSIIAKMGGGCGLPLGAYAQFVDGKWQLHAFWGGSDGGNKWAFVESADAAELPDLLTAELGI